MHTINLNITGILKENMSGSAMLPFWKLSNPADN